MMKNARHAFGEPEPPGHRPVSLLGRLNHTLATERQLLVHPLFGVGAARVMVRARAEMRRIRHTQRGI